MQASKYERLLAARSNGQCGPGYFVRLFQAKLLQYDILDRGAFMAHIHYGKEGLELDIEPISRWYDEGAEQPCLEYEIGLYYKNTPLFSEEFAEKFVALKDAQAPYLSAFILHVLSTGEADNWTMLEPKVSVFMAPKTALGCACRAEMPGQTPFYMEIKLDQNILADKAYTEYSDTGLLLKLEASREAWGQFARDLEAEEADFDD